MTQLHMQGQPLLKAGRPTSHTSPSTLMSYVSVEHYTKNVGATVLPYPCLPATEVLYSEISKTESSLLHSLLPPIFWEGRVKKH